MDFEALRARVDDVVTGIAADVTQSILEVTDSVINMAADAKAEAESYKFNINLDGVGAPEEVARIVQEKLAEWKAGPQAEPAAAGAGGTDTTKEHLVRTIYRYLATNHPAYMKYSKEYEDYNVNSAFDEDRTLLVEDLLDLLRGKVQPKGQ